MTPAMSLAVLGVLVAILTLGRWWFSPATETSWPSLIWHLASCGLAGVTLWLPNQLLRQDWSDQWAMLGLNLLEGGFLGLLSGFILYGASSSQSRKPEPEARHSSAADFGGVVHLRRFRQPRGVLAGGVMVVWNEQRGCWSSLEAALEDERNALAS